MTTQITRIRQFDGSEILKKHSVDSTLPYLGPNLTTVLSGVTDPIFVIKRIDNNGNAYLFTLQAKPSAKFAVKYEVYRLVLFGKQ
jgi:hypothetical protein